MVLQARLPFRWVARLVGMLLLAAGAAKVYGFSNDSISSSALSSPWVQAIVIEVELIVGVWLVSGLQPLGAWIFAFVLFAAFAAISLMLALIGQASCGCAGSVKINPWLVPPQC